MQPDGTLVPWKSPAGLDMEVSACLNHWLRERWLTATAADLAVLLATWLVTMEHGVPEGYAAIPHVTQRSPDVCDHQDCLQT